MRVLQNGAAKSGNYWLWRVLTELLDAGGVPARSFIQADPIHPIAQSWVLSFPEQAGLDVLDIEPGRCFYRIGPYYRQPIDDLDDYVARNRLVWSHSPYIADSGDVYGRFDKVIYLIRDPRDVARSMAEFAFTRYRQRTDPVDCRDAAEYLERNYLKHLTAWCHHVGSHLVGAGTGVHVVFYERMRHDPLREIGALADYLGLDLDTDTIAGIRERTSVEYMRQQSPEHVGEGRPERWREKLTRRQVRQTKRIAGPLLRELGYPPYETADGEPCVPAVPDPGRVRRAMRRGILWRGGEVALRHGRRWSGIGSGT